MKAKGDIQCAYDKYRWMLKSSSWKVGQYTAIEQAASQLDIVFNL